MTSKIFTAIVILILSPTLLIYGLGFVAGEKLIKDDKKLLIALILALLNASVVWWLLYEVFIK